MSSLERLRDYSSCEVWASFHQLSHSLSTLSLQIFRTQIADALLKLGNKPWGGYLADLQMWSPSYCTGDAKIIGPAYTVKVSTHNVEQVREREQQA